MLCFLCNGQMKLLAFILKVRHAEGGSYPSGVVKTNPQFLAVDPSFFCGSLFFFAPHFEKCFHKKFVHLFISTWTSPITHVCFRRTGVHCSHNKAPMKQDFLNLLDTHTQYHRNSISSRVNHRKIH